MVLRKSSVVMLRNIAIVIFGILFCLTCTRCIAKKISLNSRGVFRYEEEVAYPSFVSLKS